MIVLILILILILILLYCKKDTFRNYDEFNSNKRRLDIIFGRSNVDIYSLPFSNKIYRNYNLN